MTKGERIKKLREAVGISQTMLADKINVSKQTMYKYENDIVTNIPSDKIEAIAETCNSTPEYIMGWEEETSHKYKFDISLFDEGSQVSEIKASLIQAVNDLTDEQASALLSVLKTMLPKS